MSILIRLALDPSRDALIPALCLCAAPELNIAALAFAPRETSPLARVSGRGEERRSPVHAYGGGKESADI